MLTTKFDRAAFEERAQPRLILLYGKAIGTSVTHRLADMLEAFVGARHHSQRQVDRSTLWDQQDVLLIAYASSIRTAGGASPLATLRQFLSTYVGQAFSAVHLLPFYPYSSDDGFSVINYREVDPAVGTWSDVQGLHQDFELMLDLVLNHVSRESVWFHDYVDGVAPASRYFLEVEADADVREVVRPRRHDLRVPVQTSRGERHVWATFSDDQIDLDYGNPRLLLEMLDILLFYLRMGGRYVRLDAVAFLWKRLGTPCVHLPETHTVVKLMRDVVDAVAPGTVLITETNVPHRENVSYFGAGDEAHVVYQFSLAPLLLDAVYRGDAAALNQWARELSPPPDGCTFLNFTSSHDGIGLRPLEGILTDTERNRLVRGMQQLGAYVSLKANPDGSKSPYEINITWFDAMAGTVRGRDEYQLSRFLCTQLAMLTLRGIPAVYIHCLLATHNDYLGVDQTGRARSVNRRRFDRVELEATLDDPERDQARAFEELRRMLVVRRAQPAFHPDAPQRILDADARLFAIERTSLDGEQRIVCLHNVSSDHVLVDFALLEPLGANGANGADDCRHDLVSETALSSAGAQLAPYECLWLTQRRPQALS